MSDDRARQIAEHVLALRHCDVCEALLDERTDSEDYDEAEDDPCCPHCTSSLDTATDLIAAALTAAEARPQPQEHELPDYVITGRPAAAAEARGPQTQQEDRASLAQRLRSAEDVETGPYRIVHEIDVLAAADIVEARGSVPARQEPRQIIPRETTISTRIAERAVSGAQSVGQIEFEIDEALAQAVQRGVRQGLREAADAQDTLALNGIHADIHRSVANWLRQRATEGAQA